MRLLLDTHVALWAIADDPRLSPVARLLIEAPANEVVVSAVSVWEIAIKHSLGRGDMPISAAQALHEPLRLLTHDAAVAQYGGSIIEV